MTELTEKLCEKMNEYAKAVNGETGEVSYVVTKSRDGSPLKLQNVTFQQGDQEKLKHDVSLNSVICFIKFNFLSTLNTYLQKLIFCCR